MTDFLKQYPVLGRLAIILIPWAVLEVTALTALLFVHPDLGMGAATLGGSILAAPLILFGIFKRMSGDK